MRQKRKRPTHLEGDERKFRVGELVYLKNVGFPHNRTDNGHETCEGASAIIVPNDAQPGSIAKETRMIRVRYLIPIKVGHGRTMEEGYFHDTHVLRENRPWLRRHLREIFKLRHQLETAADAIKKHFA